MGQVHNRLNRINCGRVNGDGCAFVERHLPTVSGEIDGDDACAHLRRHHGGRQAHRSLAKNRDCLIAPQAQALQRTERGAGAASDGSACREGNFVWQRHQRMRRDLHVFGVCAVAAIAISDGVFQAKLSPSG